MTTTPKPASPLFRMALDYGPLVVFFVANLLAGKIGLPDMVDSLAQVIIASTAFMIASVIAIIVSKWKTGHISPMLWLSAGLVVVFGALTLYFRDDTFLKMKPTIVYAMFSAILTRRGAPGSADAVVDFIEELGASRVVYAELGGTMFAVTVSEAMEVEPGSAIGLILPPERLHAFDAETGRRLEMQRERAPQPA